jgi:hypothetical protein
MKNKVKYTNRRRYRDLYYIEETPIIDNQTPLTPLTPTSFENLKERRKSNFEKFKDVLKKIINK